MKIFACLLLLARQARGLAVDPIEDFARESLMPITITCQRKVRRCILGWLLPVLAGNVAAQDHPAFEKWKQVYGTHSASASNFRPLFAHKAPAAGPGECWLVAAETEVVRRHHITRVELVTAAGDTMVSFSDPEDAPHAGSYTGGVTFRISRTVVGVALAVPGTRDECGALDLFAAGNKGSPHLLLSFPQGSPTRKLFAESMFYFTDLDTDGTDDVAINRRWHIRKEDGGYEYKNEKLAYRVFPDGTRLELLERTPKELGDLIARLKFENLTARIGQHGFPRELTDETGLGEPIFPEEIQWRRSPR